MVSVLDLVGARMSRLIAGQEGVRLSLAGSQDKLPVVLRGLRIGLPLGNTPSTHIVKPESGRFGGLVANEVSCMTLAKAVGLNVPGFTTRSIGGKACIVVQRYDRTISPEGTGSLVRRRSPQVRFHAAGT